MVIISGGAKGVDTSFANLGFNSVIVTFEGHDVIVPNNKCIVYNVSSNTFEKLDYLYIEICKRLNKSLASKDYVRNLLKRDIIQILNPVFVPEIVIAVSDIDFKNNIVLGGTGYAVEVAKMYGIEIVVLNKSDLMYYIWNGSKFVILDKIIMLDKLVATGIGSRNISGEIDAKLTNDIVVFRAITNDKCNKDEYILNSRIWNKPIEEIDKDNCIMMKNHNDDRLFNKAMNEFKHIVGFEYNMKLKYNLDNILQMNYVRLLNIILRRYFNSTSQVTN